MGGVMYVRKKTKKRAKSRKKYIKSLKEGRSIRKTGYSENEIRILARIREKEQKKKNIEAYKKQEEWLSKLFHESYKKEY